MNTLNANDEGHAAPAPPLGGPTERFRLRTEPPSVTRLSRKVLAGGTTFALLVISGVVFWSLQTNHPRSQTADELYSTDHHNVADGITTLPKDYAGAARQFVPQLGPPLPGDLGRPILAAQGQLAPSGADPDQHDETKKMKLPVSAICLLRPTGEMRAPLPPRL